ncbi:hypothetical protein THAOC_24836, partial [Thalassiosira oceanica]
MDAIQFALEAKKGSVYKQPPCKENVPLAQNNFANKSQSSMWSNFSDSNESEKVRFGLEMHIGRTVNGKETASKTECVFFPRPSFFSKTKNAPALANEPFDGSIVQSVPVSENAPVEIHKPSWRERREASTERAKKKAELEKIRYFSLDQTQPIAVKDGFVTFTMHFKYLGSFISYNLRDDFDIDTRIKKAGMAMALSTL